MYDFIPGDQGNTVFDMKCKTNSESQYYFFQTLTNVTFYNSWFGSGVVFQVVLQGR